MSIPLARKLLLALIVTVAALVVAVAIALWLVLDEDRLRAQATAYVKEQTGRELTIAGPISLSFFPWLGAEMKDVSIGQPGLASGPPAARFAEVGLKVRLVPLLQGRIDVGGITARGGSVPWAGYDWRDLALSTGAFGGSEETDISLSFNIVPGGSPPVPASLEARMVFNVAQQALDLTRLKGTVGAMSFSGRVHGEKVLDAPVFESRIETGTFDLRKLLAQLAIAYVAADANAMTAASLAATVAASPAQTEIKDLVFRLDGSRVHGTATATRGPRPQWTLALEADSLNVDRYLPGAAASRTSPVPADPYASLRELAVRARVDVQRLRLFGLQIGGVTAAVTAKNGVIAATPVRGTAYGGEGALSARMDVRHPSPAYHVEGRLAGVDIQPLLNDAQSITALSGRGDVSIAVDAAGDDPSRMMEAMNGRVALSVRDGRIEGADFLEMLTRARAVADQLRGRPVAAQPDPADRTKFSRLSGTAIIVNGVARNDDFRLEAPDLQATGGGTIDLVRDRIEFLVRAVSDQAGNVPVPIAISGPFSSPAYSVQVGSMLREAAGQELKKRIERGLRGILKKPIGD